MANTAGAMAAPPGTNPGVAFDPTLLQDSSQANASIAGVPLRINPNSVSLPYKVKMSKQQTIGGMVIQVFGVEWGDLTVSGQFGAGGWQEQQQFFAKIKSLATGTASAQFQQTPSGQVASTGSFRFFFPLLNYDFQVFLKSYSSQEGMTVMLANENINPTWTLVFTIDNDNGGLATVVQDAFVSRLAEGIGYAPGQRPGLYNGPLSGLDLAQAASDAHETVQQYLINTLHLTPDAAAAQANAAGGNGQAAVPGTASAAAVQAVSGSDNARSIYNYFVAQGLQPFIAAAFVGNFMQESSCDPEKLEYGGGPGRGIAQWSLGGRWKPELMGNGNQVDLQNQLDYVWQELHGDYAHVLTDVQKTTNVTDATTLICNEYEVPGAPDINNRINYAKAALAQYGPGSGTVTAQNTSPTTGSAR